MKKSNKTKITKKDIYQQDIIYLNEKVYAEFLKDLNSPPKVLPQLKKFLEGPSIFE